ncbi:hypothetical protein PVAND_016918 [Polypedilum vanderplanki]|uniref:F-box domain-containing protein n=1 Tax=Polypedilum vanderplanki TaxID=319348 RepID=A0A9J6BH74_POLVA|nr:hypothetical protein PVAND_016918 [Polypedilum vanderplanki]
MKSLPEEILLHIFDYLDNKSILKAMKVCKLWTEIISNSSKLMQKFHLFINQEFFTTENISELPQASIKNIKIQNINIINRSSHFYNENYNFISTDIELKKILAIINNYQDSIEGFEIFEVRTRVVKNISELIKSLTNLSIFKAVNITFVTNSACSSENFPNLKSISIIKDNNEEGHFENIFDIFKFSQSLEKVHLEVHEGIFNHNALSVFLQTLPNLNHLILDGIGTASYFEQENFPFKISTLEAFSISSDWNSMQPRFQFLLSQIGCLKYLKLNRLPYDHDGGEILKFIIEEMNLEKFYYGEIPLILNGQKQEIEEIWFNEVTVMAGMEILRQFPRTKKLHILLNATDIFEVISLIIDRFCKIFLHLEELKIVDLSSGYHLLPKFICIYKCCQNVKKLKIESNEVELAQNLREFLPFMTQLEEIELDTHNFEIIEKLQAIYDCCLDLKIIKIRKQQKEMTEIIFNDTNIKIEII